MISGRSEQQGYCPLLFNEVKEEDQCQPEIHRKFINIAQGIHLRKWIHGDYEFFTVVLSGGGNWFTEQQEALSDLEALNDWSSSGEKTRLWCEWAAENARHDSSAFELDFRGECDVFSTQFYVLTIYLAPKPTHVTLGKKQKDLLIIMKSEPTDTAWMLKFPSPGGTFWCSFKWLYYRFGRNSAVPWKTLGNYYRAFYDADDVEEIIMMWCSWRRKLGRCDSPQRRTITRTRTRSFVGEFNCVLSCAFIYLSISLFLRKLNTVCLSVCQCRLVLLGWMRKRGSMVLLYYIHHQMIVIISRPRQRRWFRLSGISTKGQWEMDVVRSDRRRCRQMTTF